MKTLVVITVAVFGACSCRKLPATFKRCNVRSSDFDKCITNAIPDAIRQLEHPIKELGLPSFNPLIIPALTIAPAAPPMSFQQNYTNLRVSGFTNITCSRVEVNFETLSMVMNCTNPKVVLDFDYAFNGTFASVPIFGQGPGRLVMENTEVLHSFQLVEYVKKKRNYLRVSNSSIVLDPERLKLRFDNLYGGDEVLGGHVNRIMNDNWRDVYNFVKDDYEEAFTIVFEYFFNHILERVPKSEIFIGA